MSTGQIRHGRATVSWGPRFYGPDTIVANCPVEAFPDLVVAVCLACEQHLAEIVDSARDESAVPNQRQQTGAEIPPACDSAPGIGVV